MPQRPKRPCREHGCPNTHRNREGYCDAHARATAHGRGYGTGWKRIRERVLADAGIPRERWPLYVVDHSPPYDPRRQPDHTRYTLTPMLRAEHSSKTVRHDGGLGR